jgi:hypothetical protein
MRETIKNFFIYSAKHPWLAVWGIRICVDLEFLVLQVPEEKNAMAPASAQVGSGVVSVSLLFFSSEVQYRYQYLLPWHFTSVHGF